jgi:hypothetical protein
MVPSIRRFSLIIWLVVMVLQAQPLRAQHEYSRFELGAQYSTFEGTNASFHRAALSGFGGRFDWNLTRRLALESQLDFFPEHGASLLLVQGGRTTQAVFGVRAKVIQTRRFSVFGVLRPGLLHFTDVQALSSQSNTLFTSQPATYFVLNLGGGIEYYPSTRWILRADIEGDPYRIPGQTVSGPIGSAVQQGKIDDATRVSVGVAYRLGKLEENERETNVSGNWEFGPLFSSMVIAREGPSDNVRTEPGVGGYFSYRFYGVLYLDGDLLYFPRGTPVSGVHDGGTILQGLVGLKGGIRRNHVGFFGKARPGFHSYSQALETINASGTGPLFSYGRSTNLVLDLGGIVEFYPQKHSTVRIEVGDTHLFFGTRTLNFEGTAEQIGGGKMQHSIQLVLGYGWRF